MAFFEALFIATVCGASDLGRLGLRRFRNRTLLPESRASIPRRRVFWLGWEASSLKAEPEGEPLSL